MKIALLFIAAVGALPAKRGAPLEPSEYDALLEVETAVNRVEKLHTHDERAAAPEHRPIRSLEREDPTDNTVQVTDAGGASGVPQVDVPTSAFWKDDDHEERTPEVFVRTQHAHCPDAQCPRAKMENIGLASKGYNLLFGNPMTTSPGIDPGFTERGGAAIWKLEYGMDLETADGRFQIPDHTQVEHNVGCSLAMSNTVSTTAEQDMHDYNHAVSGEGSYDSAGLDVSFSASVTWRGLSEQRRETSLAKITSTAQCIKYHVRLPAFAPKPKFTNNFQLGVASLIQAVTTSGDMQNARTVGAPAIRVAPAPPGRAPQLCASRVHSLTGSRLRRTCASLPSLPWLVIWQSVQ